uniref:Uncharacterized protein n=1 Tax=Arundo donax TaxID=35708 RepID=A0A0A9BK51_ARUDO
MEDFFFFICLCFSICILRNGEVCIQKSSLMA